MVVLSVNRVFYLVIATNNFFLNVQQLMFSINETLGIVSKMLHHFFCTVFFSQMSAAPENTIKTLHLIMTIPKQHEVSFSQQQSFAALLVKLAVVSFFHPLFIT